MPHTAIDWLLSLDRAPLTYRVLIEYFGHSPNSPDTLSVKSQIPNDPDVISLFNKMHPDGYWLQKDHKGLVLGDAERYGPYGTTHFVLSYLSELGLDRSDPRIDLAVNRYLSFQKEDGSWNNHFSCRYTYNLRTLIKFGYRDDRRIQKIIDLMLNTTRDDGGYLCDMHEGKYKTRPTKSCIRGCSKALLAYAELPEYWDHPRCQALIDYFLRHEVLFKTKNPQEFINKNSGTMIYPTYWANSLWEPIYALSKMGFGNHPALKRAWTILETHLAEDGRAILDYTPATSPWKVGKRGKPNPWLTLYVHLAKKFRLESS